MIIKLYKDLTTSRCIIYIVFSVIKIKRSLQYKYLFYICIWTQTEGNHNPTVRFVTNRNGNVYITSMYVLYLFLTGCLELFLKEYHYQAEKFHFWVEGEPELVKKPQTRGNSNQTISLLHSILLDKAFTWTPCECQVALAPLTF